MYKQFGMHITKNLKYNIYSMGWGLLILQTPSGTVCWRNRRFLRSMKHSMQITQEVNNLEKRPRRSERTRRPPERYTCLTGIVIVRGFEIDAERDLCCGWWWMGQRASHSLSTNYYILSGIPILKSLSQYKFIIACTPSTNHLVLTFKSNIVLGLEAEIRRLLLKHCQICRGRILSKYRVFQ